MSCISLYARYLQYEYGYLRVNTVIAFFESYENRHRNEKYEYMYGHCKKYTVTKILNFILT